MEVDLEVLEEEVGVQVDLTTHIIKIIDLDGTLVSKIRRTQYIYFKIRFSI